MATNNNHAQRATLTTEELANALGISRGKAYGMVRTGALPVPAIRLGRRIVFSRAALESFLGEEQPRQEKESSAIEAIDQWAVMQKRHRDAFEQILAVCRSALYPQPTRR